jgi:hypothetical protein
MFSATKSNIGTEFGAYTTVTSTANGNAFHESTVTKQLGTQITEFYKSPTQKWIQSLVADEYYFV